MTTVWIFTIIGFILTVIMLYDDYDLEGIVLDILGGIVGALIGALIGFVIALILPTKTEIIKVTYNLEALQDNNSIKGSFKGSFFLGSGQIDGKMKYVFYYEKNGYYRLEQVDYNKAKIKYSSNSPKAERFIEQPRKDVFLNKFSLPSNLKEEYIIYVPKGAIKQNYNLDAQ